MTNLNFATSQIKKAQPANMEDTLQLKPKSTKGNTFQINNLLYVDDGTSLFSTLNEMKEATHTVPKDNILDPSEENSTDVLSILMKEELVPITASAFDKSNTSTVIGYFSIYALALFAHTSLKYAVFCQPSMNQ